MRVVSFLPTNLVNGAMSKSPAKAGESEVLKSFPVSKNKLNCKFFSINIL